MEVTVIISSSLGVGDVPSIAMWSCVLSGLLGTNGKKDPVPPELSAADDSVCILSSSS